jgi:type 2A phosphatase activator TIP41
MPHFHLFSFLNHPSHNSYATNRCSTAVKAVGGEVLDDGTGIRAGGWRFTSRRGPIASDATSETLKAELGVLALPEQWYDWNRLEVVHESSGLTVSFCGEEALRAWRADMPAPVRVAAAHEWTRSRQAEMEAHHAKRLEYDWTFTTPYVGTTSSSGVGGEGSRHRWVTTTEQMNRALLTSRDPILLFDEIPLYESELEDNGISQLGVKIRVMPRCWYVLLRFFMRVDGVMVRLREARYFGSFDAVKRDNVTVLREIKYQEGSFSELKAGGAPSEGPAYVDGDAAAVALMAVAPVGVKKYEMETLEFGR